MFFPTLAVGGVLAAASAAAAAKEGSDRNRDLRTAGGLSKQRAATTQRLLLAEASIKNKQTARKFRMLRGRALAQGSASGLRGTTTPTLASLAQSEALERNATALETRSQIISNVASLQDALTNINSRMTNVGLNAGTAGLQGFQQGLGIVRGLNSLGMFDKETGYTEDRSVEQNNYYGPLYGE